MRKAISLSVPPELVEGRTTSYDPFPGGFASPLFFVFDPVSFVFADLLPILALTQASNSHSLSGGLALTPGQSVFCTDAETGRTASPG
jgi:hypothetical protein